MAARILKARSVRINLPNPKSAGKIDNRSQAGPYGE